MLEGGNQINELMSSAIEKIKGLIEENTVIGVPFETKEGTIIIPITKISVGFVSGGGEYNADYKEFKKAERYPFAGGTGAGVSMQPEGFLVIKNDVCKLIRVDEKSAYEKLLETIPTVISKITPIFTKEDK